MTYNKKLALLSSITAALALIYALTVIFEPERAASRSAAYTWLDPNLVDRIDRITIIDAAGTASPEPVTLARKNNEWFVSADGIDYPAKQLRVDDLVGVLSRRDSYPARSSSVSSHERLSLTESAASRIIISGGAGLPLLDLLVGQGDQTGREVYLRRRGENEVRSGEDRFTAYISASRSSWYNLRLFPESEDGGLDSGSVQRLTVRDGARTAPLVFTRNGRQWTLGGMDTANPDTGRVDSYIRGILNIEGDDFSGSVDPDSPMFSHSSLTLELEDGSVRTLRLTPPDESNRRYAQTSTSPYIYSLPGWASERLFRSADFFQTP
jgi:hypothetical protein